MAKLTLKVSKTTENFKSCAMIYVFRFTNMTKNGRVTSEKNEIKMTTKALLFLGNKMMSRATRKSGNFCIKAPKSSKIKSEKPHPVTVFIVNFG